MAGKPSQCRTTSNFVSLDQRFEFSG